jgi:hypothetical protein
MSPTSFQVRTYRRVHIHGLLYFSNDQIYGTGTVWNLSLGGWRVDSDVCLKHDTMLTLFVMLPDSEQAIVIDQAVVCWSRGHEFGLAIRKIQCQDAARLKNFVAARILFPPSAS